MTDEVKLILFYLQTLHYRDDLENNLYTNLRKFSESDIISELDIKSIFKQKVHPELIKNVTDILADFKVFTKQYGGYGIDKQQLEVFIKMASAAKASRTYNWPDVRSKPFLYVSPPNIITSELSEEIDDISNLLTSLVSSATKTVSIVLTSLIAKTANIYTMCSMRKIVTTSIIHCISRKLPVSLSVRSA